MPVLWEEGGEDAGLSGHTVTFMSLQYSGVPPQSVLVPELGLFFCPCLHAQVSMKQGLSRGGPGKAPSMLLINGRVY